MMGDPRSQSLKEVQNSAESRLKLTSSGRLTTAKGVSRGSRTASRRRSGPSSSTPIVRSSTGAGSPIALRPKTFALLVHLADRAGTVVGKQELMDAVSARLVVTDDSLTQAISELRGALGDRDQQLIKTIPKRGYLFDAAVQPAPAAAGRVADRRDVDRARLGDTKRCRAASRLVGLQSPLARYGLWQIRAASPVPIGTVLAEDRSLAVMPFTDLSEPPAPHLAQAVDTDLSTDLGRLADTRVMPRSAAAPLGTSAGVDLKRVARELDVRHVVTGTVKRDGEHVQVTAQLMRADTAHCSGPSVSTMRRQLTGWRAATSRRASPTYSTCACAMPRCNARARRRRATWRSTTGCAASTSC